MKSFRDSTGRLWFVYEVRPSTPLDLERLTQFRNGWLVFFCREDHRRLAPIPPGWETFGAAELCALLSEPDVILPDEAARRG